MFICLVAQNLLESQQLKPDTSKSAAKQPKVAVYDLQGEVTVIGQSLIPFKSRGSSSRSLPANGQIDATETASVYAGIRPIPNVELYVNPEVAWGSAAGGGNGLAGYLNGDLIGQSSMNSSPYMARAFVRVRIPMKQEKNSSVGKEDVGRAPNLIAGPVPARRLVVTVGRFAASDIFDFNSYANNPRTQYINNAFVNGLAYDYPQDVRGYDYGAALALVNPRYAVRFGTFAVPTTPGGERLAYNLSTGHSEDLELQAQPRILGSSKPDAIVRLLLCRNVGSAALYRDALAAPQGGVPNLDSVRTGSPPRAGAELNFEQGLADGGNTGVFARAGFADSAVETTSYAEADRAISCGGLLSGAHWKRKDDLVGLAFGQSGIGRAQQQYLAEGGTGFSLGDGYLRYESERQCELFYLYQAAKPLQLTGDVQYILSPGYNSARGPATVLSLRLRYSF